MKKTFLLFSIIAFGVGVITSGCSKPAEKQEKQEWKRPHIFEPTITTVVITGKETINGNFMDPMTGKTYQTAYRYWAGQKHFETPEALEKGDSIVLICSVIGKDTITQYSKLHKQLSEK
ncbi:MAG: hypothetical protein JWM20_441 [Patescibacteria group bacterium]|nr:hypothetical protein [Patescibacteria group bacterium]